MKKLIHLTVAWSMVFCFCAAAQTENRFVFFTGSEFPRPQKIPVLRKKAITEHMLAQELVAYLGPGWMSPDEGVGVIKWFFEDNSVLTVWPKSHEPTTSLTLGLHTIGGMWWTSPLQ